MAKTFASFITFSVESGASNSSVMMDVYVRKKDLHYVWKNPKS
jgi:hypothetical protein